ncbi:unnamed protein product [Ectocarpus sp. CCAP 1310/34]|nr:unnamed protein product [Ectocarpus sp. CCAP 1310/34]
MSGDENTSDESVIAREEYEAERQDRANELAVISASVEDLKADMAARFAEVLEAVRARGGGAAAGDAAGVAPALMYGGTSAAAGVAPAPMFGGASAAGSSAGYGLHRVESSPGLLQGAGRYGSGGGLGFTPAISFPFGAGGLSMDSGGYGMGTGVSHAQKRMDKVISDQRVNAWSSANSRMWWVVMRCFPPKLEKPSLQGSMLDSIVVTDVVADMLLNFRGFDPAAFTPQGAVGDRLPISTHLTLMAGAFITIARRGIPDKPRLEAASQARVDRVEASFQAVIDDVARHARENYAAIQAQHNQDIFLGFLVKDMEVGASFSLRSRTLFRLPPPPVPGFPNIAAYLRLGGLINSAVQGKSARSSAAAAGAGGTGSATKEQRVCYKFQNDGNCRWGKKCKFAHVAPRKAGGKGGKRGGAAGGGAEDGDSKGSPSTAADTNASAAAAPAKRAKGATAGTMTRSSAKGGAGGGAKDDAEE